MFTRFSERFRPRTSGSQRTTALIRIQRLFGAFALFTVVLVIPALLEAPSAASRATGTMSFVVVVTLWIRLLRHGTMPWWLDLVEFGALVIGAASLAEPGEALTVIYVGMGFRCLYDSRPRAIGRAGQMFLAYEVASLVFGGPESAFSAEAISQAPMFVVMALVIGLLAENLRRQDAHVAREAIVARASSELLAATETGGVDRSAAEAASEILGGYAIVLEDEDGTTAAVTATGGHAPMQVGDVLRWEDLVTDAGPDARCLRMDLDVRLAARTVLLVELPTRTSEDDRDAVERLAPQLSMALERVALTEQLRLSHERSSALVRNASEVVRLVDADGIIIYESDPVLEVLGWRPDELVGTHATALMHPEDRRSLEDAFAGLVDEPNAQATAQVRMRHRDGTWRRTEGVCKNLLDDPAVGALVVNYRDITERHELEERLRHQALHDPLTELPNRDLFADRVRLASARARRAGRFLGVVFVDLDDFKEINDGFGHAAGDEVLKTTARRLADTVRASDTASRMGGDEFALLLEGIDDPGDAYDIIARVLERIRQPIEVGGEPITIRASVGIVLSRGDDDADELLRRADVAMYEAKDQGKGRFEVFELGMHDHVRERLALRSDLEAACEEGQIVTHYQPVVELTSGGIVGVEALVRWQHPDRGLLAPGEFIDVAERTGLIVDIGRVVLADACAHVAGWNRQFGLDLSVHVNVSPRQLLDAELVNDVQRCLRESGLAPDRLTLEITEGMLIADAARAAGVLAQLRASGIRLALDDFGTGYSSLAHLQQFGIDVVKIDRSFVAAEGEGDGRFSRAIVGLGQALGLDLIAEGIEQPGQAKRLQALGCPHGQGFLYARPMPAGALGHLLTRPDETPAPSRSDHHDEVLRVS